jgi:hypothetical protein
MRAIQHHIADPQGWPERVSRARAEIARAGSLEALADVLNSPAFAALPLADLVALPSYGGERPSGTGVFSWDAERVLVMTELADGFAIERRSRT